MQITHNNEIRSQFIILPWSSQSWIKHTFWRPRMRDKLGYIPQDAHAWGARVKYTRIYSWEQWERMRMRARERDGPRDVLSSASREIRARALLAKLGRICLSVGGCYLLYLQLDADAPLWCLSLSLLSPLLSRYTSDVCSRISRVYLAIVRWEPEYASASSGRYTLWG